MVVTSMDMLIYDPFTAVEISKYPDCILNMSYFYFFMLYWKFNNF